MEQSKINPVFLLPIKEVMRKTGKRNKHGIRVQSSVVPEKRDGINEWFERFTI